MANPFDSIETGVDMKLSLQAMARGIAMEKGIPQELFLGMIDAESSWNPMAKNPKSSARGLGQHLDRTAKNMGLTITNGPDDPRHDPETSLRYAADHLLEKYAVTKDWHKAVNAYGENTKPYINRVLHIAKKIYGYLSPSQANAEEYQPNPFDAIKTDIGQHLTNSNQVAQAAGEDPFGNIKTRQNVPVIKAGGEPGENKTDQVLRDTEELKYAPAPWDVLAEVGFADTPQAKFEILARHRFPRRDPKDMASRYFMRNGNYYYFDDTGNVHTEVTESRLGKIKQFVSETLIGRTPEMVLGALGQAFIPIPGVGAGIGTAAGGTIRRGLNEYVHGEKKTIGQYALGAGVDFAEGSIGDISGRGIAAGLNRLGKAGTGQVGKLMAQDAKVFDPIMMQELKNQGARYGINLTAPEITQSPTLRDMWVNLAKTPGAPREKISEFLTNVRTPEIQAAINREIGQIGSVSSAYESGSIGSQAAKQIREGLEGSRKAAANKYFTRAWETDTGNVELAPVFEKIDAFKRELPNNHPILGTLKKVEEMLEAENSLQRLHNAKGVIDLMFKDYELTKFVPKNQERMLVDIKNTLVKQMVDASPEYGKAMQKFKELSRPLADFDFNNPDIMPKDTKVKSVILRLSELQEGKYQDAPNIVFGNNSPEMIKKTRSWFIGAGKESDWNELVAGKLQKVYSEISDNISNREGAIGATFHKKIFGNLQQREQIKEAMGKDQFERFSDFMDLLQKTGRLVYTNSETAFQLGATQLRKEQAGGALAKLLDYGKLINPSKWGDMTRKLRDPIYSSMLTDALMDPATGNQVFQIKKVSDPMKQAIMTAGLLASIMGTTVATSPKNVPLARD